MVLQTYATMLFSCFGSTAQAAASASKKRKSARKTTFSRFAARRRSGEAEMGTDGSSGGGERRTKRKVVVVGDGECGKTCLLQRFCRDAYHVQGYLPTVFDTHIVDVQLEDTTVELMIADTAGQEDYDRLRPYSYPDADVILVCFAIDSPDSLENVRLTWLPEIRHFCGSGVPVLLVGTKMDLRFQGEGDTMDQCSVSSEDFLDFPGCSPSAALIKQGPVKVSSARKLAAEVGAVGYWETSALLDQGISEVFREASHAALVSGASGSRGGRRVQGKDNRGRHRTSFLERIGVKSRPN